MLSVYLWLRRRDLNPRPYGPEPYALPTALRLSNVYYIFKLRFSQTFLTYINLYNCVFNAIINKGAPAHAFYGREQYDYPS